MIAMLFALDYFSVLIYGVLIMFFFLDIKINRKNMLFLSCYVLLSGFLQFELYYVFGSKFIEKSYPLLIHLPVVIFFYYIFKKRLNLVLFALFTSYIFTAPRRWIGQVVSLLFNNDPTVLIIAKVIASVMLLFVIYKYLCPYVNRILKYSSSRITLLTVVPAISYCIAYATTVYTDALYHSNMLVVGLFSVGFNSVFYLFIIAYSIEMDKNFASQIEQTILEMQRDTTLIQIEEYKKSQQQGAIYRHDLRHHLQYLSTCIAENHTDEALAYITKVDTDVAAILVKQYCENTSVNLILSAYATKAKNNNIDIEVYAVVPMVISMHFTDICVILSNGIENAIHACNKIENESNRKIRVSCKFENKKLLLEICNNFDGEIQFEGDIPISTEQNHGLGVKSIIACVKKYQGLYSFTEENGIFTMRGIL
jgi:two-component system sensor histidine kinase AgrC